MDWRARWALMEVREIGVHQTWYRFQYLDGTQRQCVADGRRMTIDQVCTMLDQIESQRPRVDARLLDRAD